MIYLDATPGAREIVILSRIAQYLEEFDTVIVDLPASGHALGILRVPKTAINLMKSGPVHDKATQLLTIFSDEVLAQDDVVMLDTWLPSELSHVSKVEKSILDYYDDLGNPADKADFKTYLVANLRLYFDRWENSLQNDADPQFSDDVNKAVEDAEADIEAGEVGGSEDAPADEGGEEDIDLDI